MKPDLQIENHGSVVLLRPLTPRGSEWLDENVFAESWQWFGGALAAEPRLVEQVIQGAVEDGLVVEL